MQMTRCKPRVLASERVYNGDSSLKKGDSWTGQGASSGPVKVTIERASQEPAALFIHDGEGAEQRLHNATERHRANNRY